MSIHAALVIDKNIDDCELQVLDLTKIQPVGDKMFVIKVENLPCDILKNGAGEDFTTQEIITICEALNSKPTDQH